MSENTSSIVSKVWSFCNVLRDGGVSYGDYLEQLTFLIFLKMAEEYRRPPYGRDIGIPQKYTWDVLKQKRGAELDTHYKELLEELGKKRIQRTLDQGRCGYTTTAPTYTTP